MSHSSSNWFALSMSMPGRTPMSCALTLNGGSASDFARHAKSGLQPIVDDRLQRLPRPAHLLFDSTRDLGL